LVIADGIGGRAGGDVASRTVVERFRDAFIEASGVSARRRLLLALRASNDALHDRVKTEPLLAGMGSTLVAATFHGDALQWVSVGDSAIWLVRDHRIRRLNARHSVGAMLDEEVRAGRLSARAAAAAPDRSHLLAAVLGRDIRLIDAPSECFPLLPSDRLVLGSDGLESCSGEAMVKIAETESWDSTKIVDAILREVEGSGRPHQDNASVVAVRFDGSEGGGAACGSQ